MAETNAAATGAQQRVVLNIDRCIGCRSCSAACYHGHRGRPGLEYGDMPEGTLPIVCRQCEEPACVAACPVDALRRETGGIVKRSLTLCIGCRSCAIACPFGVIDEALQRRQVGKCDLCEDRVLDGRLPRCVSACPAAALVFETIDDLDRAPLVLSGRTVGLSPFKRR